jgi:tetratricopeptide (TPR) repeat protein
MGPKSQPLSEGGGGTISPREVYETTGDSEASLNLLVENSCNKVGTGGKSNRAGVGSCHKTSFATPQDEYNARILTSLATASDSTSNGVSILLDSLGGMEETISKSTPSSVRKRKREEMIMTYNRGLILLASGKAVESIDDVWTALQPIVMQRHEQLSDDSLRVACRLGFLLLEALLTVWPMRSHRPAQRFDGHPDLDLDTLMRWLVDIVVNRDVGDADPQLKFMLHLYKSRVDFFERDRRGRMDDANIRSARKELKQAMDIFQHKLRAACNDSGSLASSSYSEDLTSAAAAAANNPNSSSNGGVAVGGLGGGGGGGGTKSPTPLLQGQSFLSYNNTSAMTRPLQGQNQAALNLKANTEQLKGNIKKSLILCAEANASLLQDTNATTDDGTTPATSVASASMRSSDYYEAVHQNNLGIVYETSGKSHLALHAFSKAIRLASSSQENGPLFESDGTARPDLTFSVLHNAAICSLKAGNYMAAYECMALCIRKKPTIWAGRPQSWLRLAEACIGTLSLVYYVVTC